LKVVPAMGATFSLAQVVPLFSVEIQNVLKRTRGLGMRYKF